MDEISRRRMLWLALVASAGFFLATLLLAAANALTNFWYFAGAVVYAGILIIAIVGWLTERGPEPAPAQPAPPAPAAAAPAQNPVSVAVQVSQPLADGPGNGHGSTQPPPAALPLPAGPVLLTERVVYSTPRGHVLELARVGGGETRRDFDVESEQERPLSASEVERLVDRLEDRGTAPPTDPDLRRALLRWGRLREDA